MNIFTSHRFYLLSSLQPQRRPPSTTTTFFLIYTAPFVSFYSETVETLIRESGVRLEHPNAAKFRHNVLAGCWDLVIELNEIKRVNFAFVSKNYCTIFALADNLQQTIQLALYKQLLQKQTLLFLDIGIKKFQQ